MSKDVGSTSKVRRKEGKDGMVRRGRGKLCIAPKAGSNMGLCEESVLIQDEGLLGWKGGVEQHWMTRGEWA
jgi:hypothetical protein